VKTRRAKFAGDGGEDGEFFDSCFDGRIQASYTQIKTRSPFRHGRPPVRRRPSVG